MKKIYIKTLSGGMFLLIFVAVFSFNFANATVGGPTFIHEFKYNPTDESVYFIETSFSGRGCPPQLMKISLVSGKTETVFSCDDGEKLMSASNYDYNAVGTEINKLISNFKYLVPINLRTNKIFIDVNFVNYEKFNPDIADNMIKNANYTASVYQNEKKVTDLPIKGCNLEQPFTFAGYAIPGFEKKIILLLSTKGNCFEGGYTDETLYVVGGVSNLEKNNPTSFYKGPSALTPNEGTLTIYESDKPNVEVANKNADNGANNSSQKIFSFNTLAVAIGISAIIAVIVGLILGKLLLKTKTP